MKAISLRQPWATLIAIGAKRYESRRWATRHRGLLAIHACKAFTEQDWEREVASSPIIREALARRGYRSWQDLPTACVVATVQVMACLSGEEVDAAPRTTAADRAMSNIGPGYYDWVIRDVRPVDPPVRFRGAQGLWNLPDRVIPDRVLPLSSDTTPAGALPGSR